MFTETIYSSTVSDFVNIPAELKALPNWVCWKLEERKNPSTGELRKTKPPYQPSGNKAKSDDHSTWSSYNDCVAAMEAGSFDGIGFEFDPPYVGVDLDKCRDPETGQMEPWVQEIIDDLNSYAELSPSGKGVHIILKGLLPAEGRRKDRIEMYSTGRFFTMTGKKLPDTPSFVRSAKNELLSFHEEIFPDANKPVNIEPAKPNSLLDAELLAKAMSAKNGAQFKALWNGDMSHFADGSQDGVDHSAADLSLCKSLAFWTGRDIPRMDALFRASGLMRPKWDERHGTRTYGAITLQRAAVVTTDVYTPSTGIVEAPIEPKITGKAQEFLAILRKEKPESFDRQNVRYLIEPEIPNGALVLVTGKPGSGKTTLILKWCFEMAAAGSQILYLDRDNPLHSVQDKIERFGGKLPDNFLYCGQWNTVEPPLAVGQFDFLKSVVKEMKAPVVVFDTLNMFSGAGIDENDNSAIGDMFKSFRALTHLGATVIVVHHVAKSGMSPYRGASSMAGAVDAGLEVVAQIHEGKITYMDVNTFKTRLGDGAPTMYEMIDDVPVKKTLTFEQSLFELLKKNPGLTKEKFEQLAKERSYRRATVREFLDKYLLAGKIRYDKKKLYVAGSVPATVEGAFDE